MGQTPKEVLDKAAKQLEKSKGASAEFTLTHFEAANETQTKGTIEMQGRKFHLTTPDMQTWFDGQNQWSMLTGAGEVNLQEPTDEELARMNPYAFIALYKQGYRLQMKKDVALRDAQTYEVQMTAEADKDLATIIVNIDMKSLKPLCIRMKHNTDWVRIAIYNLDLKKKYDKQHFTFPTDKYPDITLIDLR